MSIYYRSFRIEEFPHFHISTLPHLYFHTSTLSLAHLAHLSHLSHFTLSLLLTCVGFASGAQTFPQSFVGNWKGELLWYQGAVKEPKKVNMELKIQPAEGGNYTWQIIYGSATEDNRPYTLMPKDTAKGHWQIDEHNGIILDQFWIANRFSGAFTVQNSTIVNTYWLEGEQLHIEFYSTSAKPIAVTGKGTEESPSVNSYGVKSYQKAILRKM